MQKIKGLSVIECKYCYNAWNVDMRTRPYTVNAKIKEFKQPRDVDLYHLCGVYTKANVLYRILNLDYENYKSYNPCFGVSKNVSDLVCEEIKSGSAVMFPGGYCLYAPAVAGGIQRAVGEDKKSA